MIIAVYFFFIIIFLWVVLTTKTRVLDKQMKMVRQDRNVYLLFLKSDVLQGETEFDENLQLDDCLWVLWWSLAVALRKKSANWLTLFMEKESSPLCCSTDRSTQHRHIHTPTHRTSYVDSEHTLSHVKRRQMGNHKYQWIVELTR